MPQPRRRRVALSPWTDLDIQTSWSVSGVRAALQEHEQGYFQQSGRLIESLGRDIRLGHGKAGVIGTRANALLGSPFRLKPADEESPRAVKIAAEMEAHWWTVMPEATLRELLRFYWLGGGGPGQLKWHKRELQRGRTKQKSWLPIVEPWQLQSFYHEENTLPDGDLQRQLMAFTRKGTIPVTPGDGTWLLLADGPRWWLNGSVRPVAIPWLGVQYTTRDWWRHSERLGHPIVKAKYPAVDTDPNIDAWLADLKALATETTATLPQGVGDLPDANYDLDLLEAAQHSPESFERLLLHTYGNYAIHFLGHNNSAEIRQGQAVTSDASEVRTDYKKADNETLSTQLREQLTVQWAAEWYPDGAELAPWPWWDVEPKEDTKQKAETQKLAAETLETLAKTGHEPEDLNEWAEPYDLRLRKIEPAEPEPETKPPGDDDEDDDDEEPPDGGEEPTGDELLSMMLGDLQQDTFAGGLAYADELVDAGVKHARAAMAPAIRAALDAVDGAETPEEAREALLGAFESMDPDKLAGWLGRAMVLAELKGQETVLGEL
jgi:hypothetical protein